MPSRNLPIACSISSALGRDLKNSSSSSQGSGSRSSSNTLSCAGSYLSDSPGSSRFAPRKPIPYSMKTSYNAVHDGTYVYVLVRTIIRTVYTSMCLYVLVYTSMYWYVLVYTGSYSYALVHTSMYTKCTSMYWYVLVCTSLLWYILVRTRMY